MWRITCSRWCRATGGPCCTSGSGRTCPDPMHRTGRFMPNPGHCCDGAFAMRMSSFGGSFRPPFDLAGRIFTHRRPKRRRHGRFRPGGDRFRVPTAEGRRVSAAGLLLLAACSGGRWLARRPPRRESAGGASNRWAGPESVPGGGLGQRTFGRQRSAPARNIGAPDPGAVPGHAG